ncbi:MAG: (Fe-S)-binding protein [Acidimicrobiales bacterium]
MRCSLLITCVVDVLTPEVGDATVRVLRAAGCDVTCDLGQTCCGQPAWNAGFADDAAKVARTTLAALERELDDGAAVVVVPAGSCATMVRRFWPELFRVVGDEAAAARAERVGARTRELTELVAGLGDELPPLQLPAARRVAWHHSCHLLRELGVRDEPGQVLDRVGACERLTWAGDDRCCGFGGLFSVALPEVSEAMADEKLASLPDCDGVVVGADSSCLVHLRTRAEARGRPLQTRHIAELLAAALPRPAWPERK